MQRNHEDRRVGGVVTQRIANPIAAPTKSTSPAQNNPRTDRKQSVKAQNSPPAAWAGSGMFPAIWQAPIAPCLRRAAPIALFALCARFVADSGAFRAMSRRVSLGYAKKRGGVAS